MKAINNDVIHNIAPIYNQDSKILILGSFPSIKSREESFFYAHPQNKFWKVLSIIFKEDLPTTLEEKKEFLLKNNIAVWDVIHSCNILGSSDSSIKNVIPNDISIILNCSKIKAIFVNGKTAFNLYIKHLYPINKIAPILLPSTSPANAKYKIEDLIKEWRKILEF